jgi:hypothetical protein
VAEAAPVAVGRGVAVSLAGVGDAVRVGRGVAVGVLPFVGRGVAEVDGVGAAADGMLVGASDGTGGAAADDVGDGADPVGAGLAVGS